MGLCPDFSAPPSAELIAHNERRDAHRHLLPFSPVRSGSLNLQQLAGIITGISKIC